MPDSLHVKINLIGKEKVSVKEDFLKWAVKVGRVIIITTELLALAALLFRFSIDRKIIDLHDKIKNSELLVLSQKAKEESYRSIQARLDLINKTDSETKAKIGIMTDILVAISAGNFTSTNLTVDKSIISLEGTAFSIFPINAFIEDLKKNPNVSSISVDDISSSNQGIQFKINIELKPNNT
jgi:hypothetical protein